MRIHRFLLVAAVVCGACDTGSGATTALVSKCDFDAHGIVVSPPSVTLTVGDSMLLAASPPTGPCVPSLPVPFAVFWRSSNPAIVKIDSMTGRARGIATGATTVLAIIVGDTVIKGAAAVQVNPH
jgi:uncharacterized protein YjdB